MMYLLVHRMYGGHELCQNRAWFRRKPAERARAREMRRYPTGDFEVQQVSFWQYNAFWSTISFWFMSLLFAVFTAYTMYTMYRVVTS